MRHIIESTEVNTGKFQERVVKMTDKTKKRIIMLVVFLVIVGALAIRYVPRMLPDRPKIPELNEWAEEMEDTYSSVKNISLKYLHSGDLEILVKVKELNKDEAAEIKESLSEIIVTEEFHEALHADASEDYGDEFLWASGFWPDILLIFQEDNTNVMRSEASYYKENYNSGMTIDEYTYDGYNTWNAY